MIPSLATVRAGRRDRRDLRLWLPLFLFWPLLLPFAVLLAVAGPVAARLYGYPTDGLLRTAWQLVTGWRGTHIEVDTPDFAFQIRFV